MTAAEIFRAIGRRARIAVANREQPFLDTLLRGCDHAVRADVIVRCEKYVRDRERKRNSNIGGAR